MGQGRQISRGSHRTTAWHHRVDPHIEQGKNSIHQFGPAPGVTGGQHIGAQQQHGPDHRLVEWLPNPAGMGTQQIQLQPIQLVGIDPNLGQLAEPGVDPVDHLTRVEDIVHDLARRGDPIASIVGQLDLEGMTGYRYDIVETQASAINLQAVRHDPLPSTAEENCSSGSGFGIRVRSALQFDPGGNYGRESAIQGSGGAIEGPPNPKQRDPARVVCSLQAGDKGRCIRVTARGLRHGGSRQV